MGRGEFRGAAALAAVLAVVTVLVAWRYDLPVRDPDGVSVPTWIRLPLIVLAAVALDVVPRWIGLARRGGLSAGDALRAVLRDRWNRDQVWFTVSGLATWYVAYVAFRNLKSYVPFVNDRLWDAELARLDRMLWFGHDPAETLHQVLGTGWAAWVLAAVYVIWIGLVPATLAIALVWTRRSTTGAWFVTAVSLNWALGAAVYYAIPSLGPVYASPETFAQLPHTPNTDIQQWLLEDRVKVLAGPWDTNAVQTIAAFASLHVAVIVTICLVAEAMRLPVWLRVSAWTFAVLTVLATVYLGWHYFTDVLGGIAIGVASLALAGRITSPRRGPRLRPERAATSRGDRDEAGPARSR
jgi:membrane-associated phospholipid phosphatase